jgi:hypothetical protein
VELAEGRAPPQAAQALQAHAQVRRESLQGPTPPQPVEVRQRQAPVYGDAVVTLMCRQPQARLSGARGPASPAYREPGSVVASQAMILSAHVSRKPFNRTVGK